jgi:hypothetical protein
MTNIQFLARFLSTNPGVGSVAARRALCDWKGVPYREGQYSWYFSKYYTGCAQVYGYWEKQGSGWHLTEKGLTKV